MADQITTLAKLKTQLRIATSDTTDDAFLTSLIEGVTDYMSDVAGGWHLVPEPAATYVFDTAAGGVIPIRRGIRTVTLLELAASDQPDTGGTYSSVAAADVLLRPVPAERRVGFPADRIMVRGNTGRLSTVTNGARVTGDFGFAATPPQLERFALEACALAYTNRRQGGSSGMGDAGQVSPEWSAFFAWGSPGWNALQRLRAGRGIG